LGVFWIGLGV
jgi:hypothetical protein